MEGQLTVGLAERAYPIHIRAGLMTEIGDLLREMAVGKRYAVISDDRVAGAYGQVLLASMANAGIAAELLTFPCGEANKNIETVGRLTSELARRGFDRKDAIVALGGGVTGDIAGFVASIYLRGIPFVQVPTTLLAQVDSSVGGKTGVDIPEGKNLVGTFYQPRAVFIDTEVLATLPAEELRGGLAEVIKYGVIVDREFFAFMEENRTAILDLEPEVVVAMIRRSCELKAAVVARDEREGDIRRILNFGHTIGHAVEAVSRFSIIHGLAVAIGMRAAADLAVLGGHLQPADAERIRCLLEAYAMPVKVPAQLDRALIKQYLLTDKKTVGGRIFFVLPTSVGRVIITDQVPEAHIDAVLANA